MRLSFANVSLQIRPQPPSAQLRYPMAHSQYSRQNNWNSISQNHSLIILSTRQEKEGKKRKKEKKKIEALHQWKLFPLTDSFGGQISSSSFSLDEGMESCLISSSLWIGHWGGGGIKSEIESEEGKNNLQVIESTIIFPKNKFLIIVICCFADKKAISVYFLISPIHSAIMQNIHAIYLTIETRNCSEEIALNLFCRAEKHNLNDHLHHDFKQK